MLELDEIADVVREQRKLRGITQHELARQARVSRALIAELETHRLPEVGFKKLMRILGILGLDLRLTTLNASRPTLDDLKAENQGDDR
jgi:transcriptional regulator with XRE-family HTH domain